MSFKSISVNADEVIKRDFIKIDKEVLFVKEIIEHDGYDRYGPESDLFTLYIFTKEDNEYVLYRYYYEYWYDGNLQNYDFELKWNVKDISLYDLEKIYDCKSEIKNSDLLSILEPKLQRIDSLMKSRA
jgi:hypothetical protein